MAKLTPRQQDKMYNSRLCREWKEAMEKDKDAEIAEHLETVGDYLADVVTRLFSVTESLYALKHSVNYEKRELITGGKPFAYQQGILDVVTELFDYATGKRDLEVDKEDMREAMKSSVEVEEGIYQ